MTVFKVHISYFKDFDRNFQNNYYFVLFPSIQFLNNLRQLRLTFATLSGDSLLIITQAPLLVKQFSAFFKVFFIFFFKLFSATKYCV